MRVVFQLPNDDLRRAQQASAAAEAAGFDGIVALENAHGPFPALAVAALATERVQIGTAVAIAFPRSPTIMAHAAWDLNKASGGRFYLGLGSQVKGHNERRYGIPWSAPAPRMRDYIGAVRAVWRAWEKEQPLDYHSDHYDLTLTTPNFSPRPLGLPRIPVAMSAVGPAMLRCAGEVADGVRLHPFSTRRYLQEVSLARIGEGIERQNRSRSDIEVVSGAFIATGADEEAVATVREYVRFRIAFYCSTRAYWHVLQLHSLPPSGLTIPSPTGSPNATAGWPIRCRCSSRPIPIRRRLARSSRIFSVSQPRSALIARIGEPCGQQFGSYGGEETWSTPFLEGPG
jgi:probable F420-dependent oxidoreductase